MNPGAERKAAIAVLLGAICLITLVGCVSSGYWSDRGRDAMDILSLTVGYGAGTKARIGPLETGLLFAVEGPGLRGGDFLWGMDDYWHEGSDLPQGVDGKIIFAGFEVFEGGKTAMVRGKSFASHNLAFWSWPINGLTVNNNEVFQGRLRDAGYVYNPWPFYTQVTAVVALGPAVRAGANPGELLDFVLGWTTVDLYSDDLSRRPAQGQKDEPPN